MKKALWILFIVALIAGCYYDNEEWLYPNPDLTCDTTGVAYSKSVVPILQTNCYSCHSSKQAAAYGNNIDVEKYSSLKQSINSGSFYGAVIHKSGYSPMPKGGARLDTCSLTKIKIWIDKGALNN